MSLLKLDPFARELPVAWKSQVIGSVGSANIKVLRMDEMSSPDEVHDYNEGLLVVSGLLRLKSAGREVMVNEGEIYIAEAGVPHAVLSGSHGALVIIDLSSVPER